MGSNEGHFKVISQGKMGIHLCMKLEIGNWWIGSINDAKRLEGHLKVIGDHSKTNR